MNYYLIVESTRKSIGPFLLRSEVTNFLLENTGFEDVVKACKAMGVKLVQTVNIPDWEGEISHGTTSTEHKN